MPKSVAPAVVISKQVVVVVEDDPLVRQLLRDTLEDRGWGAEDYASGEEFLAAFRPEQASCLIFDAKLPGMSGLDVLIKLRSDGVKLPAIIITGASDLGTAITAMRAGANDFLQKPILGPELLAAVERVLDQGDDSAKAGTKRAAAMERIEALTARQREIMTRVVAGQLNKNIAADLGISQRTVETHRAKIMERTRSKSLPDLTRLVLTATWPEPVETGETSSEPMAAALSATLPPGSLDDDQFRRFFDAMPMAIIIARLAEPETIVYANPAFVEISGQVPSEIEGKPWPSLRGFDPLQPTRMLGHAILEADDRVGQFTLGSTEQTGAAVDAYVSVIVDDDDRPSFRLAALVAVDDDKAVERDELEEKIKEKDTIILEIQHRVKNNLQMITALIRAEARNYFNKNDKISLDRLEGRINSIQIMYKLLSDFSKSDEIDLGVYLSEIASSLMHSHAVEGIRLELKVDAYPVSVNVALPTGLVANELLTNALKHAFVGRDGGIITLHSLADSQGCKVTIADNGVGLPAGADWPKQGKMGELIVRSLRQNAKAELQVDSTPGKGTKVTIAFNRAASAPVVPAVA
jgi:FixJ family two-component response regulator/two-component sensor histidine kinase